jgi:FG-GAP-like repeat
MTTFTSFTAINVPGIPVTDIYTSADGIDAAGDVVGNYGDAIDEIFHGFVDSVGVATTFDPPNSSNTDVLGITYSGEIFGDFTDEENRQHGFIYSNGNFQDIDVFLASATNIYGVTDGGVIYGSYVTGGDEIFGFVENGANFTSVAYPGNTTTSVTGVNASGEIVGVYDSGQEHGFSDINGVFTSFDPPGSVQTYVNGVTGSGEIVGTYVDAAGNEHGFVVNNGVIMTIDVPGAVSTSVNALNGAGEVVGDFVDTAGNVHGFIYSGGVITQVDAPGATETDILAVNDAGVISGYFNDSNGQHAFVGSVLRSAGPTLFPALSPPIGAQGAPPGPIDFNGDGKADTLWRQSGTESLAIWLMNGAAIAASAAPTFQGSAVAPDSSWSVVALGDFNGGGNTGVVWRQSTTGALIDWAISGSAITSSTYITSQGNPIAPDASWSVAGAGDFAGNGTTQILWRQSSGALVEWSINGSAITSSASLTYQGAAISPDSSWSVAGIGDFNGDGTSDILWRQGTSGVLAEWRMNGATIASSAVVTYQGNAVAPDSSWSVVAAGDFTGNGHDDLLWRQGSTGTLALWLMNGSTIGSSSVLTYQGNAVKPDSTWNIVEVGDCNGGADSEILWRQSTTGVLAEWQMNGAQIVSSQEVTWQGGPVTPNNSWQTQAKPTDFA